MLNFLSNKSFLSLILIFIPFLSFANANLHSFDFTFFSSLFFILFLIIISIFLLAKFLSFFWRRLDYKIYNFILSFIFFTLFYLFSFFKDLLIYVLPIYNSETSLVFSITFLIFFSFIFFYKENSFFNRFFLIYLIICFFANLGVFAFNTTIFLSKKNLDDPVILIDSKGTEYLKKNKKKNMYFVIVDGAIALNKFDEYYNTNYFQSYTSKLEKLGFNYIKDTKSAYPSTVLNLTSLFYLDYPITEENYKNFALKNIFPVILQKSNANKVPLIKNLKKINYKFKWFGNSSYNCKLFNLDFCLDEENKDQKRKFVSPDFATTFLRRSPIIQIHYKISNYLGINTTLDQIFLYPQENDSLGTFINQMKNFKFKNEGYFFLIHNFLPHQPYVFNSDCILKKDLEKISIEEETKLKQSANQDKDATIKGYKEQYKCMLKRIDEFANFINKNDPDSNIIITSDHGHDIKNFYHLRYDSFVMVKVDKNCQKNVSNNLNVPNGIRLILGCTVGQKFNDLEKKAYYVDFKKGHFVGGQLRLDRVDPNNYYEYIKMLFDTGRIKQFNN